MDCTAFTLEVCRVMGSVYLQIEQMTNHMLHGEIVDVPIFPSEGDLCVHPLSWELKPKAQVCHRNWKPEVIIPLLDLWKQQASQRSQGQTIRAAPVTWRSQSEMANRAKEVRKETSENCLYSERGFGVLGKSETLEPLQTLIDNVKVKRRSRWSYKNVEPRWQARSTIPSMPQLPLWSSGMREREILQILVWSWNSRQVWLQWCWFLTSTRREAQTRREKDWSAEEQRTLVLHIGLCNVRNTEHQYMIIN